MKKMSPPAVGKMAANPAVAKSSGKKPAVEIDVVADKPKAAPGKSKGGTAAFPGRKPKPDWH